MNVVVVGAGTMGSGIAYSSAAAGHNVTIVEQDQKLLDAGLRRVQEYIDRAITRGHLAKNQASTLNAKLRGTTDFSEACKNAGMVVEAVFEDPSAQATHRPDRVVGLHFFKPVPTMKLVELIKGGQTSETTVRTASGFVESLGKTVVQSQDKTGFIVNKALMPFLNESIRLLEQGVASKEDIDKAFVLGTNHPMGPLQLSDFIGVDIVYQTLKVLEAEYGGCFKPTPLLEKMMKEGKLGRKTGRGFYDY